MFDELWELKHQKLKKHHVPWIITLLIFVVDEFRDRAQHTLTRKIDIQSISEITQNIHIIEWLRIIMTQLNMYIVYVI